MMQFLDESLCCPVCMVQFPNVPRALAHLTETRIRGSRPLSCRQVCLSGLVKPASPEAQAKVAAVARAQRKVAKQSGHVTPLARAHAKRPRVGTIVPSAARSTNSRDRFFTWEDIRPSKRLRSKTHLDLILAPYVLELIACRDAGDESSSAVPPPFKAPRNN